MTKFEPSAGKVLVKPDETEGEKMTSGGIIIPDTAHKPPVSSGRVVAEAADSYYGLNTRVVYSPYSGYSISIDSELFLILGEHEILGSFSGEARVLVR